MTRWKAAAVHLGISLLVISSIFGFMVWVWYPPGELAFARPDKLLLILAGIDIAIGPLLTLLVYRHGKPSLRFDLTVIALLQAAFLCYGLWTAWHSRPVYVVAVVDRLEVVFANEIDEVALDEAADSPYARLPCCRAPMLAAPLPDDDKLRQDILEQAIAGRDIRARPRFYQPYEAGTADLLQRARPLTQLPLPQVDAALARLGRSAEETIFVPITSARGDAAALLDAASGQYLMTVDADPWGTTGHAEQ